MVVLFPQAYEHLYVSHVNCALWPEGRVYVEVCCFEHRVPLAMMLPVSQSLNLYLSS